ncbi:MAG: NADH:ubiquinone oxidoreductase subunit NDUFA12 [Rhodospirillales bacterium]|nr:NADH:ubiquinone oxidoreductase subunit NDUFA12 [Rhodospirillales bacterium]
MATIGTLIYTWLNGSQVGADEFGNRYYEARNGAKLHDRRRRWVLFKGEPEASKVPSEWHAWLHHMTKEPLTDEAAKSKSWQKPHIANMTGTVNAYRPKGHDFQGGQRARATGDYEAWSPE